MRRLTDGHVTQSWDSQTVLLGPAREKTLKDEDFSVETLTGGWDDPNEAKLGPDPGPGLLKTHFISQRWSQKEEDDSDGLEVSL